MTSCESYKHQFAKATLAQWLREAAAEAEAACAAGHNDNKCAWLPPIGWRVNREGPNFGVWTEYPICLDDKNEVHGDMVWDEQGWPERPPTYDEVIGLGLLPIAIFDIALSEKGMISEAFEVVHRHGVSETKTAYLKRIGINV